MKASTRVAFTDSLTELAFDNPNVVLVCADSTKVVKSEEFAKNHPERLIDVGIAEQNALATAAGLASTGMIPYVATYAGFITMRACEQVRTFVAYPGLNVKMVGANGGMAAGEREGVTHQFFEDLGILRTIPGISIVAPADAGQVKQAVKAVASIAGPAYIRIGSGRDPVVYQEDVEFKFGKIRIIKALGNDVALFTYGHTIPRVLAAAELLAQAGIGATVVEVHTLKPLDRDGIVQVLQNTKAAVTVEDHNIIGGLGSAIAEVIAEDCLAPLARVGIKDCYPESGEPDQLLDKYGLKVSDIIAASKRVIAKKKG